MPAISVHLPRIKEHFEVIEESIKLGIEKRPATLAFNASACSIDLLETYLHKLGKISIGAQIKHEWFKRPKPGQKILPLAERKLAIDFPAKKESFELLYEIEERRNKLIYGKPTKADTEILLTAFDKLKIRLLGLLAKEGVEL